MITLQGVRYFPSSARFGSKLLLGPSSEQQYRKAILWSDPNQRKTAALSLGISDKDVSWATIGAKRMLDAVNDKMPILPKRFGDSTQLMFQDLLGEHPDKVKPGMTWQQVAKALFNMELTPDSANEAQRLEAAYDVGFPDATWEDDVIFKKPASEVPVPRTMDTRITLKNLNQTSLDRIIAFRKLQIERRNLPPNTPVEKILTLIQEEQQK